MPYCSKCGKPVTVAPIICSECQMLPLPEAAEVIIQKLCDEYCRWPREAIGQDALDAKCDGCELDTMIHALTQGR